MSTNTEPTPSASQLIQQTLPGVAHDQVDAYALERWRSKRQVRAGQATGQWTCTVLTRDGQAHRYDASGNRLRVERPEPDEPERSWMDHVPRVLWWLAFLGAAALILALQW